MIEMEIELVEKAIAEQKITVEPNRLFHAFGSTYIALRADRKDPCCKCAFQNDYCFANIDIPACKNGVIFKKVKGVELCLFENGDCVSEIKKFENGYITLENGKKMSVEDIFSPKYEIRTLAIFE